MFSTGDVMVRRFMQTSLKAYMQYLHDGAEREYRQALLSLFERDPSAIFVDLGCDEGSWTLEVAKRVDPLRLYGVDLVQERYAKAIERGISVRKADLNGALPFTDGEVTVLHSNQVIEHVHDLDSFVLELFRILSPGGYGVICTENLASWHNIASLMLGLQPFSLTNISRTGSLGNRFALHAGETDAALLQQGTFFHTRVLALSAFLEIFRRYGFIVERCGGTGYYPLPHTLARTFARVDPAHSHFIYAKVRKPQ